MATGWVTEVKSGGKEVKILPRVLFEGWSVDDYMKLFADQRMMQKVAEFINQSVKVSATSIILYLSSLSNNVCLFPLINTHVNVHALTCSTL